MYDHFAGNNAKGPSTHDSPGALVIPGSDVHVRHNHGTEHAIITALNMPLNQTGHMVDPRILPGSGVHVRHHQGSEHAIELNWPHG